MAPARFRRADRILRSREFREVIECGARVASGSFVVFLAPASQRVGSDDARSRLGITVSRRVGNAVTRNHVKRRIRDWFRHERDQLPSGARIVVIARPGAAAVTTPDLRRDLDRAIRRPGLGSR